MCYYNGIRVSRAKFIRLKNIEKELRLHNLIKPMQNGFDYQTVHVIKPNSEFCDWEIVEMEWGFIPNNLPNRDAVEDAKRLHGLHG